MKALSARESRLAGRRDQAAVPLVVLTTFTDRDAETVDQRFYLSDRTLLYPYDGTDREFEPYLAELGDLAQTMPHIPAPSSGLGGQLRRTLDLALANQPDAAGTRLVERLRQHTLEGARVEVAELLLDRAAGEGFFDARALSGSEHTVFYRGEVTRVGRVTDSELRLEATTRVPRLPWLLADDAALNDPEDHGQRLPIVYGAAARVPAIGWQVGWTTTLAESLAAGATGNVELSDATGLPDSGSFTLRISGEEVTASKVDAQTVNVTARGQSGTTDSDHAAGEVAIELVSEAIYVVAGHAAHAIGDLFLRNPFAGGELVRVTTGFTKTPADTNPITGATVATVRFTQAQLRALLEEAKQAASVTQQPDFEVESFVNLTPSQIGAHVNDSSMATGNWPDQGATPRFQESGSSGLMGLNRVLGASGDRTVVRWRLFQQITVHTAGSPVNGIIKSVDLPGGSGFSFTGTATGQGSSSNLEFSAWKTPPGGTLESNFNNTTVRLGIPNSFVSGEDVEWIQFGVQLEVKQDATQTQLVQVAGASVGFGLRFFADVEGYEAQVPYGPGYGYEDGAGWNAASSTTHDEDTASPAEGSAAQGLTASATEQWNMDALSEDAGWGTGGFGSIALETTDVYEGAGALRCTAGGGFAVARQAGHASRDFRGVLLAARFKITTALWNTISSGTGTGARAAIISVGNDASNRHQWHVTKDELIALGFGPDEWIAVAVVPDSTPPDSTQGAPDLSAVTWTQFVADGSSGDLLVDQAVTLPAAPRVQKNDASAGDLGADAGDYRIAVRGAQLGLYATLVADLSDAVGSGATAPGNRRELRVPRASVPAAFADRDVGATDVGAPTVAAVDTVGVALEADTSDMLAITAGEEEPTAHVDDLRVRDDALHPYTVAIGTLLEHPADILRHLLVELLGEAVEASSWSTVETRLSGNKHATDLRELGQDFAAVVGRLAFETRASLTQEEAASGSVWRIGAAQADAPGYSWPGTATAIEEHGVGVAEEGRDLSEVDALGIYTRLRALYDVNRGSPERGEGRFRELLVANADRNDVSAEVTGLAAAQQKWGAREHPGFGFLTIRDAATARDVFGYYVHELTRLAATILIPGVPWVGGVYAMDRQDLATLVPPWESAARRLRVVGFVKSWDTGLSEVTGVGVTS